ncbi:MAG: 50S ribosomal protein L25/general stress protein Ctc [Bacillus sp. (in: firmicutes)]
MGNTLVAKERTEFTSAHLHEIRNHGGIPAVLYGNSIENKAIEVDVKDLRKMLAQVGMNGVIQLEINGQKENVMMKEYQYDSLNSKYIHADFQAIDLSEEISADVQLKLTGEAQGTKEGGILQQVLYEVTVTAKPGDLPESIEVDIAGLQIGDTITIADIRSNTSVEINQEDEEVIASVLAPRLEEESEAEEASAEPTDGAAETV